MKKAIIYSRVSSNLQSSDRQDYSLQEFAKKNNYQVIGLFSETVSGAKSQRNGFEEMKDYLFDTSNRVDLLLCSEISRLGRSRDVMIFIDKCVELGINIYFQLQGLYLLDENNRISPSMTILLSVLNAFAISERTQMIDRIKDKYQFFRENGKCCNFKAFFGEKVNRETRQKEIDLETFEVSMKIFNLRAEGNSFTNIRSEIKSMYGISLSIEKIRGCLYFSMFRSQVSEDVLRLVDSLKETNLKNRGEKKRTNKIPSLIRGLVVCGSCGGKLAGLYNTTYYRCLNTKGFRCGSQTCETPALGTDRIEAVVWTALLQYVAFDQGHYNFKEKLEGSRNRRTEEITERIDLINSEIEQGREKLRRIGSVYISGILSETEFELKKKEIDRAIERLDSERTKLLTEKETLKTDSMSLENIGDFDYAQRCECVSKLVEKVIYLPVFEGKAREFQVKFKGTSQIFHYYTTTGKGKFGIYTTIGYEKAVSMADLLIISGN